MEMRWCMVVEEHSDDDSEKCRDDRHRRMLTDEICDRTTDHSLSCARPPHATVPDSRKLAKHEGLQVGPAYGRALAAAKSCAAHSSMSLASDGLSDPSARPDPREGPHREPGG